MDAASPSSCLMLCSVFSLPHLCCVNMKLFGF
jgi:hypothetical protein